MAAQDPVAQDINPEKLKDIFPEHESIEEQEKLDNTNEKLFQATQTYENLKQALPTKIEI
jgi:hypothetical protein